MEVATEIPPSESVRRIPRAGHYLERLWRDRALKRRRVGVPENSPPQFMRPNSGCRRPGLPSLGWVRQALVAVLKPCYHELHIGGWSYEAPIYSPPGYSLLPAQGVELPRVTVVQRQRLAEATPTALPSPAIASRLIQGATHLLQGRPTCVGTSTWYRVATARSSPASRWAALVRCAWR
jgi:hypothetical protein